MLVKCPHCQNEHEVEVNAAAIMGSKKKTQSPAAVAARKENAKKGGWPKGRPRKPKPDAAE